MKSRTCIEEQKRYTAIMVNMVVRASKLESSKRFRFSKLLN